MLSQVSQIQKLRRRPSMMLESEHQQHFWEEHFGNDAEISVERYSCPAHFICGFFGRAESVLMPCWAGLWRR
jgi:hypothetical protein